jgi:hypothetical protein
MAGDRAEHVAGDCGAARRRVPEMVNPNGPILPHRLSDSNGDHVILTMISVML